MSKYLRDYKFSLVAGIPRTLNVDGESYYILDATRSVNVTIDDNVAVTRVAGQGSEVSFKRITFVSDVDMQFRVTLGTGRFIDNARVDDSGNIIGESTYDLYSTIVIQPNSFEPVELLDVDVRDVILSCDANNDGYVLLNRAKIYGDSVVDVTEGTPLWAGNRVTFSGAGIVYLANTGVKPATVFVTHIMQGLRINV